MLDGGNMRVYGWDEAMGMGQWFSILAAYENKLGRIKKRQCPGPSPDHLNPNLLEWDLENWYLKRKILQVILTCDWGWMN